MRAFMSRVHPPSSALHAEWLDHPDFGRFADDAEREARRILAETEPERDAEGWLTAHVPASFPEHGHTELAEALAAFVAD